MKLKDYQIEAIDCMKNGCILCGYVGSGKSLTAIGYFVKEQGCDLRDNKWEKQHEFLQKHKKPLYIITTARKRDTYEWEGELIKFHIDAFEDENVTIDSWNNIGKYKDVKDAFFIFDEQRVVGYGKWSKTFIKIFLE